MPHCKPQDLPSVTSRGWGVAEGHFQFAHRGDMEVSHTVMDQPIDCTGYRVAGLPGGLCPCPHYFASSKDAFAAGGRVPTWR